MCHDIATGGVKLLWDLENKITQMKVDICVPV